MFEAKMRERSLRITSGQPSSLITPVVRPKLQGKVESQHFQQQISEKRTIDLECDSIEPRLGLPLTCVFCKVEAAGLCSGAVVELELGTRSPMLRV